MNNIKVAHDNPSWLDAMPECFHPNKKEKAMKKAISKRKNSAKNIICPVCSSGKKFKNCCW